MNRFQNYLGDIAHMTDSSELAKGSYIHPRLRNLGSLSLVLVREIVAPTVFRNSEAEITDIEIGVRCGGGVVPTRVVRAVPNKFKHKERGRGLQILRHFGVGGRFPQNRSVVPANAPLEEVFDLNSVVFGDSVIRGKPVLPVKAAVLYSDGLSLREYDASVGKTFHNRASEDGTLYDAEKGENSNKLFDRHFIVPGTLLVQVISTHGRLLPQEGLDHLLLSIGEAGSYGGQTSVSGVNVRTHIAGIYASRVERAETSPFHLAAAIIADGGCCDVGMAIARIHEMVAPSHESVMGRDEAEAYRGRLLQQLVDEHPDLEARYAEAADRIGDLFVAWFGGKEKDAA